MWIGAYLTAMARAAKLKVFRTAIGFHDAYVAAPSRKAALQAWGSDKDLFARGVAELVTDPQLGAEPLAKPGTVIKRLRGSAAEQLAALPPAKARPAAKAKVTRKPARAPKIHRPSRATLDAAERAIAKAEAEHDRARRALIAREAAIARERRALAQAHKNDLDRLERARVKEAKAFDATMRRWRG